MSFWNIRSSQLLPQDTRNYLGLLSRATFDCAGAKIFFVFSIFDDHAVLCAVKSDKRKFKDKPFVNRWSASQIKHITAKSNSKLKQKILFDIDYQSFAVVASLFVWRCRRSTCMAVFLQRVFGEHTFELILSCLGVCFRS